MMRILLFVFLGAFCLYGSGQQIRAGKWQGKIHYSKTEVPFAFEVSYPTGEQPLFTFLNGAERIAIETVEEMGDSLYIQWTPFDVEIRAAFTSTHIEGIYHKKYRDGAYPFSATFGKPRMEIKSTQPSITVARRWEVTFSKGTLNESKGLALFSQQGERITGTILTEVSDYRYFEGIVQGDSIQLSSFDGAHAFKIEGKRTAGVWRGIITYDEGYEESWEAIPNATFELRDPFEIVILEPGLHKPYFELLAAGSGQNILHADDYEGKVVILQLFGTWCPNSLDQTQYLTQWYDENRDRGVEIVASSFEANYSRDYGLKRLAEYKTANDIQYPLVLGGRLSKNAAAMSFPFMNRIEAFPTLVLLDKEGYARSVISYFNGPATGPYHEVFKRRFNAMVDELLAE